MDKLKRYNQKLLAIIGTTIIVLAAVLLIIGLFALIVSIIDSNRDGDTGIQIRNNPIQNDSDSTFVRTQQITFQDIVSLDTNGFNFLIPVGQVNLENPEKLKIRSGSGFEFSSSKFYYDSYYGLYNNFILFEYPINKKTKIFDQKVAITYWANVKSRDVELVLFKGTGTDSNSDGIINTDDFQSIYAYFISDKKLIEYTFNGKTVVSFEPMNKTDLISVKVGIDKNEDNEFDSYSEPQEVLILDVRTRKIQNVIAPEMMNEIQKNIDS